MVDIATLLGADRARAEVELKDSLQFEMKLANVNTLLYLFRQSSSNLDIIVASIQKKNAKTVSKKYYLLL